MMNIELTAEEKVFYQMMAEDGYTEWWESEERWEAYEEEMMKMDNLDKEEVYNLFREMEEDL